MNVDEEPAASRGVNICDYYSRQWCSRTLSLASVLTAIMYISFVILYTCYSRMIEMDSLMNKDVMRPIAAFQPCTESIFNLVRVNETNGHDYTLKIISMNRDMNIIVQGAVDYVRHSSTLFVNCSLCPSIVVFSVPVVF